jgi:hypothetical protein
MKTRHTALIGAVKKETHLSRAPIVVQSSPHTPAELQLETDLVEERHRQAGRLMAVAFPECLFHLMMLTITVPVTSQDGSRLPTRPGMREGSTQNYFEPRFILSYR